MIKFLMNEASSMGVYPALALVIFIAVFVAIVVWVLRMNKGDVDRYSRIPLEDDKMRQDGDR